jgi:hypothetical protein
LGRVFGEVAGLPSGGRTLATPGLSGQVAYAVGGRRDC